MFDYNEPLDIKVMDHQPTYVIQQPPIDTIHICLGNGSVCGTLKLVDGKMNFSGDLDESAKVLFELVCRHWNEEEV